MKLALEALTHIHGGLVVSSVSEALSEQVRVKVVICPSLFESSGRSIDGLSGDS